MWRNHEKPACVDYVFPHLWETMGKLIIYVSFALGPKYSIHKLDFGLVSWNTSRRHMLRTGGKWYNQDVLRSQKKTRIQQ